MHGVTYARPLWLFLLPLFFVFHGYVAHYPLVEAKTALWLFLFYASIMALLGLGFQIYYRNRHKALLAAFGLLCLQLFFGAIQDGLKATLITQWMARYSLLVPILLLLLAGWLIWLYRMQLAFINLTRYINLLLLLYIALDAGLFIRQLKNLSQQRPASILQLNKFHNLPDVYLIILDEYTASSTLNEVFGFDNSSFERELRARGFHILPNSSSNYNYTPYSIASLLQMNYLELDHKTKNPGNIDACYGFIRNSPVVSSFVSSGYRFYNYSLFDINHQPALMRDGFLPYRSEWITRQTFTSRLLSDLRFDLNTGRLNWISGLKQITYEHQDNNQYILEHTARAGLNHAAPKLVYAHLMLPHYPYFFNHEGQPYSFASLVNGGEKNQQHYIEYLQYGNRKVLELIDRIRQNSRKPPVILMLGDHGFRHFDQPKERRIYFSNFSCVLLPSGDYKAFYDSISPVNLFRALFNTVYGQQLPLLKDSSIYLWE